LPSKGKMPKKMSKKVSKGLILIKKKRKNQKKANSNAIPQKKSRKNKAKNVRLVLARHSFFISMPGIVTNNWKVQL